ncbi:MAG: Gfo/Idh/MocA family oxidoreductase [Flavobacteriaceae bacterium]|nr:Gfo/Idh/MocA family oxidoreductase [Flavobacteriaceae bacterium]MCY4266285.1 Gfo/Idh/MocA family oxidoreductase [Flavobacteriaceae bacterium]
MLTAGVLGAGHLGRIHIKNLQVSPHYHLIGYYDPKVDLSQVHPFDDSLKKFSSAEELMNAVDVVNIVTPTLSHYEMAKIAINKNKHIFIEKPIAYSTQQANEIIELAFKNNIKGQVGHVERFNPAFKYVENQIDNPMFIETHRLAEFNPRGTDVSVVLDLMIHDIDIILHLVSSHVKKIEASGVSVISKTPDICNARISFENGCVANLTASRISLKKMRKSRFFQKNAYISIDFLSKKTELVSLQSAPERPDEFSLILKNAEGEKKQLFFEDKQFENSNAILEELDSFAHSIVNDTLTNPSLEDGAKALNLALEIAKICSD